MSQLSVVGTILFLTNLMLPLKPPGLTLVVPLKKGYVAVMYIPFCVKRTLFQLGNHNDGTFPFDSSFIKVETDLMFICRNFPFPFFFLLLFSRQLKLL